MFADFSSVSGKFKVVGIAVSGGIDSMALLHYAFYNRKALNINPVCINVEHGIRGEQSVNDSLFVKDFCLKNGIPFFGYSVDCLTFSKENKLSLEQGARVLRYECFLKAISSGRCEVIATAHHRRDNVETVLFNMFRGAGLSGLRGISEYENKIVRPLLFTDKSEIEEYVKQNGIGYVTDTTNESTDYTRNYIRLNVLPAVKKVFPEAERSVSRLIKTVCEDDDYLNGLAKKTLIVNEDSVKIPITAEKPIFCRAVIMALKILGLEKDWEKVHTESAFALIKNNNGASVNLPKNIVAVREYDGVVFYKTAPTKDLLLPFTDGVYDINGKRYCVKTVSALGVNLKDGIYLDKNKVPENAVIRYKRKGDKFTKINGGTKNLSDFFTDKKIPKRLRDFIPLVASDNEVLTVFDLTVSEKVKADKNTVELIKITKEN